MNSIYEWDYYVSNYLVDMGILKRVENSKIICKIAHPQFKKSKSPPTKRKVTRNYVKRQLTWWRSSSLENLECFNEFPVEIDANLLNFSQ